jgi:hypothetical protein
MSIVRTGAAVCALSLMLAACGRKEETMPSFAAAPAPVAAPAGVADRAAGAAADRARQPAAQSAAAEDVAVKRHIAVRHQLQLSTDASAVESAWNTANQACNAADCDILSSTLVRDDEHRPALATLEARVPAQHIEAFLARVTALGTVGQHQKTAEDKTDEVIDVEARIRNTAEFRDNLRHLMAERHGKLSELIEVERELVRVQSELDSLSSRRKALANQTEKVHVVLNIQARSAVLQQGLWAPVHDATVNAGRMFAGSVAVLVSVTATMLPWLLLLGVVVFVVRRVRRLRRAQDVMQQDTPPA